MNDRIGGVHGTLEDHADQVGQGPRAGRVRADAVIPALLNLVTALGPPARGGRPAPEHRPDDVARVGPSRRRRWQDLEDLQRRLGAIAGSGWHDGTVAGNVLGGELKSCGTDPMTGFYRDGCCDTGTDDAGVHTVCAVVTEEFRAARRTT